MDNKNVIAIKPGQGKKADDELLRLRAQVERDRAKLIESPIFQSYNKANGRDEWGKTEESRRYANELLGSVSKEEAAPLLGDVPAKPWEPGRALRYTFLVFVCAYSLGSQSTYDSPFAIGSALLDHYQINDEKFGLLYSAWSFPNLLLVYVTGVLVDKMGPNWSALGFNLIILTGAIICWLSGSDYYILLGGMITLGVGAGSILVPHQTIMTQWFKGKELAMSFGIATTVLRLASVLALLVQPTIANKYGVGWSMFLGVGVTILSVGCTIVCMILDHYRRKKIANDGTEKEAPTPLKLKDILKLSPVFWILCILCMAVTVVDFVFELYAVNIFEELPNMDNTKAGQVTSTASIAIIFMSPIIAWMLDRWGRYAHWMIAGCVVNVIASLMLLFIHQLQEWGHTPEAWPWVITILFGLGYSSGVATVWPSVGYLVDANLCGTAFGIMTGVLNLGLFVFPYIFGFIQSKFSDYFWSIFVLTVLSGLSALLAVFLFFLDMNRGKILYDPVTAMKLKEKSDNISLETTVHHH